MDPFAGRRLNTLTAADLEGLVEASRREDLYLEYMGDFGDFFSDNKDRKRNARRDFLAEVTAFANADGGLILVGVEDERDDDGNPTGIAASVPGVAVGNTDKTVQAIEQILAQGIDERLQGVELVVIAIADGMHVVAIRVAASLRGPHMVTLGGGMSFYVRTNTGKQPMSTAQIRDAVLQTEIIAGRVRAFVDDRLAILQGEHRGPFWVVHVMPLQRQPGCIDVTSEAMIQRLKSLGPMGVSDYNHRHTVDGFRNFRQREDGYAETTCARDGWFEFFDSRYMKSRNGEPASWPAGAAEAKLFESVTKAFEFFGDGLIRFPCVVTLTMHQPGGIEFKSPGWETPGEFEDRDIRPEPLVLHEMPEDVQSVCRPIIDFVWNAAGSSCCPAYTADGKYKGYGR